MERYFLRDYAGPAFERFGPAHVFLLAVALASAAWLFAWKPGIRGRSLFRWSVSILLIANDIGWHAWKISIGEWTVREMLPLHLSGILVLTIPIMMLTRNRHVFAFVYFAGLPGTILALLAPELGAYGFPHYRVLSFFLAHILIFIAPIYMVRIEGMRPTWKQMWAVWGTMAAYTILIMGVNSLIGSNYLFVSSRPDPSEVPGPLWRWPWYVLMEAVFALIAMIALRLPFGLRVAVHGRAQRETTTIGIAESAD